MRLGIRRGNLRAKIVAWSFVPTIIILAIVMVVNYYGFQRLTEDLVFTRDEELTTMAAGQLALQLAREPDLLVLVSAYDVYQDDPTFQSLVVSLVGGTISLRAGSAGSAYLVDDSGRVIYHTVSRYRGQSFSGQVAVQRVLAGERGTVRTVDPDGVAIVASFAPVPDTPWGLVNQESWETLGAAARVYRQLLFGLLVLAVVVPTVVTAIGVRQITQPMDRLADAAGQIARGNFEQRIQVSTGDILEELAEQFNHMATRLQESYTYLEQRVAVRTRELATLNEVAFVLSEPWDLEPRLTRAVDIVLGLLEMEMGEVRLLREGAGLVPCAQCGPACDVPRLLGLPAEPAGVSPAGLPTEPLVVENTYDLGGGQAWAEGVRAMIVLPLRAKDRLLGCMTLATRRGPRPFTQEEETLLRSVSDQVGLAVENARLHEEARQRAVAEERNRLARELHDSVAQMLYGVTLYAEATARQLTAGDVAVAGEQLRVLREMAQDALREMLLSVFALRPSVLQQEGLVGALRLRLEAVEGRGGLATELDVGEVGRLSAECEEGIYGIVQEALNNVLRHAQAHHVVVRLHQDGCGVVLEVADDGVGFDTESARAHGGLGLVGMAERAARIGGQLRVVSEPGAGTRVILQIDRAA